VKNKAIIQMYKGVSDLNIFFINTLLRYLTIKYPSSFGFFVESFLQKKVFTE